ncbi:hypothetical protein Q4Q35_07480 [Flavivirga aquimarina]|uniref:Penicillin-binding protein activator LpoB n=1 Tax=Flavivirga aquimarina TaxID=2027862 RepID=A0ABT8W936_9FLAO|nr:hypothetical protein [Flavivirga aquimarina]MDO5969644.1 hypothetical protein [Flavivirga aquimarina]
MKKILLITSLFFITIGFAQKTTIGLQTFKAINADNWKEAEMITEKIKEVFVNSKRFTALDRTMYTKTSIFAEKEIQKNIDFINGYVVKQGRSKGAKHIIGGKILISSYSTIKSGEKKCDLSFSINVSDVETGELMISKVICPNRTSRTIGSLGLTGSSTEDEAFINALLLLEKKINDFIEEYVSFYTDIVDLEEVNNKKGGTVVKTVLVNAGIDDGMHKNDKFSICEVTYVETSKGKKKREREIAVFKVSKVQGEVSEGKITKGGEELAQKFNDKETVLVCKSVKNNLINI